MKPLPLTFSLSLVSLFGLCGCNGTKVVEVPSKPNNTAPMVASVAVSPEVVSPVVAPKAEVVPPVEKASPEIIAFGANWKYTISTEGYEGDWKSATFDDASWSVGKTPIGYGDDELGTKLDNPADIKAKILTVRGRIQFEVGNPASYGSLRIRLMRDDGIVVYLNGEEVVRDNLPAGALKATTLTPKAISGAGESEYLDLPIPAGKLVAGKNILAVAVHQNRPTSSDLWFDVELTGEVK